MENQFNNKPLVSIVVNCFNCEKYLSKCIESIISQTYKNWELVFWDNQSSDSSKNIFKNFKDERLKYFYAEKHTTLYKARDLAIQKCNGKFIAFLDSDDWWEDKKLEKQIPKFKSDNIGLVYSNLYFYYQKNGKKKIYSRGKLYSGFVREKIIKNYKIGIISAVIRKEAYEKSKTGFGSKYNIIGDFDFFVRLSADWNFECVQEPLAYYRLHENNFSKKNLDLEIEEFKKWHHEYFEKNFLNKLESKYLLSNIEYLRCKKLVFEGKRLKALSGLFLIKNISFSIKLLIRILLPNYLIRLIQDYV